MDSPVVRELRDHHLKLSNHPFSLQLLGITAHVYADTFSHFGFSGVSSRGNKVDNSSFLFHEDVEDESSEKLLPDMRTYIMEKKEGFFNSYKIEFPNINSWLGEKAYGTLGHGAVATFPDRPYLVWSFKYERPDAGIDGIRSIRNNPETFLMSCRALHSMFKRFVDARSIHDNGDYVDFDEIESKVQEVLLTQANKVGRVEAWQRAAQAGQIFESGGESIPEYDGEAWNDRWDKLDKGSDYTRAEKTPMWRFYQAASIHRTYVLRDLLPKHGLIVN